MILTAQKENIQIQDLGIYLQRKINQNFMYEVPVYIMTS